MSVISDLRKALKTVTTEIAQDTYAGSADTYITYNVASQEPDNFVDDAPKDETVYLQVHLYLPIGTNYLVLEKNIKTALFKSGFSYPSVSLNTTESDTEKRHICLETDIESEV